MRCNWCEFRCDLSKGSVCGCYHEQAGKVAEKYPEQWLPPYFFPMEALPFYHVIPNAKAMQLGAVGCNAGCEYCINAHISIDIHPQEAKMEVLTPASLLHVAKERDAQALVFAINEVTVRMPSALAVTQLFHENGLKVGCLTNGFQTEEAATLLAENMDFINVSLKSIRDEFYQRELRLPAAVPVLRNIRIFKEHCHVEIVTPIADDIQEAELYQIADFIEQTDRETPWHLFRLFQAEKHPNDKRRDYQESIDFTEKIRARLPYTYFENFPGSKWVDTICPGCGHTVVKRISIGACGSQFVRSDLMDGDRCPFCGQAIPIVR